MATTTTRKFSKKSKKEKAVLDNGRPKKMPKSKPRILLSKEQIEVRIDNIRGAIDNQITLLDEQSEKALKTLQEELNTEILQTKEDYKQDREEIQTRVRDAKAGIRAGNKAAIKRWQEIEKSRKRQEIDEAKEKAETYIKAKHDKEKAAKAEKTREKVTKGKS